MKRQLQMLSESYAKEDELMELIDAVGTAHFGKMRMLRNTKFITQADVEHYIKNIWLEKPEGDINYRYIWACWLEEQEEVNSNGW